MKKTIVNLPVKYPTGFRNAKPKKAVDEEWCQ